jgi:tetratricopeptide (TPR) repeat protein
VELLNAAAVTYGELKQFPAALEICDRLLDIKPNDPDVTACEASIYQGEGNLKEAARLLSGINEISSWVPFTIKMCQLRCERNYAEIIRLLEARAAQYDYASENEKGSDQVLLAFTQRLAGDAAGAKLTAEQARNTLEPRHRDKPDDPFAATSLSRACALMGKKDLALKLAERLVMLKPRAKDSVNGPSWEENLALVQTIAGENEGAISTLSQLLQTPYESFTYCQTGITPALLRLDPIWDPLRGDPAFQKLCQKKQK